MAILDTLMAFAFASTDAVSTTALALVDISPLTDDDVLQAQRVRLTCAATGIRYRYDGGDPTVAIGHLLLEDGETFIVGSQNIRKLRIIRDGGTDAAIAVTLER